MNRAKLVIGLVLALFVPYTLWVVFTGGNFSEMLAAVGSHPWNVQISLDLVIALSMVCVWMANDARERGRSAVGWIVATACLGSIGPLLYLLTRTPDERAAGAELRARAV